MVKTSIQWVAIRKPDNDSEEFIDVSSIRCLQELTYKEVDNAAINNPYWHKGNPVQRVTQVEIKEINN